MALVEVKVPDIGDFEEVAVIEVLVKVGDTVKAEQSLITVESTRPRWRFRRRPPAS
jgi:pyruvate/2-oxoglutarate dehydrogenase complex dihydrolipoamide acyltransferase (E2) component